MRSFLLVFLGWELCNAHNWMVSPSRVPFAATVFPCMPPRSNLPLVQVAQGQQFQMEWSVGHDREVYFVLLKKSDSEHLANNREDKLDRYIAAAPNNMMSPHWAKKHRSERGPNDGHVLGGSMLSHYASELLPGQPNYLARPESLGPEMHLYTYSSSPKDAYVSYTNAEFPWIVSVWRYEIQHADPNEWDVALFDIPTALTASGGDFVIHYLWSGYYDCIDINVQPTPNAMTYVYGKPTNESRKANRIDHCVYDEPYQYTALPRLILNGQKGAALSCINHCKYYFGVSGCSGLTVFPLSLITKNWGPHWNTGSNFLKKFYEDAWNPSGHFKDGLWNVDDGMPTDVYPGGIGTPRDLWRIYTNRGTFLEYVGVHQTTVNTLRAFTENPFQISNPDPWVCVPVHPRTPTTTIDKMTISDDPLDPVWGSTCYEIVEPLEFVGYTVDQNEFDSKIPFRQMGGSCISCSDAQAWQDESYAPTWELAAKCYNCDRDVPAPTPNPPRTPASLKQKSMYNWVNYDTNCATPYGYETLSRYCEIDFRFYHELMASPAKYPPDWGEMGWVWPEEFIFNGSPELCYTWASKQPQCSDYMYYRNWGVSDSWKASYPAYSWYARCGCIRRDPCCENFRPTTADTGSISTHPEWTLPIYDMKKIPADPACTTGIKNQAGTYCCSGTCEQGCTDRTDQNWYSGLRSFCQSYNIPPDRWCSEWGPPCRLQ